MFDRVPREIDLLSVLSGPLLCGRRRDAGTIEGPRTVPSQEALAGKYVVLFFGNYEPFLLELVQKMRHLYTKLIVDGEDVEVVFVSNDREELRFQVRPRACMAVWQFDTRWRSYRCEHRRTCGADMVVMSV